MEVNGFEIRGRSVSGYSTAIALPEYGLCFDCGMATHDAIQCEHVVITHGHLDHFGGIARHAYIRGMTGRDRSKFIVPDWLDVHVTKMMKFWADVQEARVAPYYIIDSVVDRQVSIGNKRFIWSFKTDHRIRSQGYMLTEKRKCLKKEFIGTPGKELGRLRGMGIEFEDTFEVPLVAFTGDTRATLYDRMKLGGKVLIAECTFLDDVSVAEAHRKGHTCITELAAKEEKLAGVESLVLCHFSKRYGNRDIEDAIKQLPKSLREKTTFLPVGK